VLSTRTFVVVPDDALRIHVGAVRRRRATGTAYREPKNAVARRSVRGVEQGPDRAPLDAGVVGEQEDRTMAPIRQRADSAVHGRGIAEIPRQRDQCRALWTYGSPTVRRTIRVVHDHYVFIAYAGRLEVIEERGVLVRSTIGQDNDAQLVDAGELAQLGAGRSASFTALLCGPGPRSNNGRRPLSSRRYGDR
jgi:hypothetical protein